MYIIKNKTNVYTKFNYPLKAQKSLTYTDTKKEDWKLADLASTTRQELNQRGITFTGFSHLPEVTPLYRFITRSTT